MNRVPRGGDRDREHCPELSGEALERHLFVCAACRADARLEHAWSALRESGGAPGAVPLDERFVSRVLALRRTALARERRARLLAAAAAVLLFFFFTGTGSHRTTTDHRGAEEALVTVLAPSPLDGLLSE